MGMTSYTACSVDKATTQLPRLDENYSECLNIVGKIAVKKLNLDNLGLEEIDCTLD